MTAIGAGPRGVIGVNPDGNRAGDILRVHGSALYRRDGDAWILSGTKQFITHGRLAAAIVVIAVTDPAKRTHGMSAFVVDRDTRGLRAGRKENKLGMRASDTSEVIFEDCRVPAAALIGEEGEGFIQTMQILDNGRVGIAALAVGLAQGAYEKSIEYAKVRHL